MELHQDVELLTITSGDLAMPYEWSIGLYGSRFFKEIREHRRFLGIRCPSCGKVRVPPCRIRGLQRSIKYPGLLGARVRGNV